MNSKYLKMIMILFFIFSFVYACNEEPENNFVESQNFETAVGIVQVIDDYPLYSLKYFEDYKFDTYLRSGIYPFTTAVQKPGNRFSCTCFSAFSDSNIFFGRNYDWSTQSTYYILFTDPDDGYSSISTVDLSFFDYDHDKAPDDSHNQKILRRLPYYPFDGMNEKGIAIGMNAVDNSNSPYDPSKITIGELQLIRLVLDYASTTSEAINLIQQYNIRMEEPPIHYLITDSSGHSVIIEFVNGKMVIINNQKNWEVTTNFIISDLPKHDDVPCWRYKNVYSTLQNCDGILDENEALSILKNVSVSTTRWSTLFDLNNFTLKIAMGRDYDSFLSFSIPQ